MEAQELAAAEIREGRSVEERSCCVSWAETPRELLSRPTPKAIKLEPEEPCWEARWQEYLKMLQDPDLGWRPVPFRRFPSEEHTEEFHASTKGEVVEMNLLPKAECEADPWPGLGGEAHGGSLESLVKVKEEITEEDESLEMRRQDFRRFPYQEAEGPREICRQLLGLCCQWLKPDVHTVERILDLLVLEQFLAILPEEIQSWVRGGGAQSCAQAVSLAEHFLLRVPKAEKTERQVLEPFEEVIVNSPKAEWELPGTKGQQPLSTEAELEDEREAELIWTVESSRQIEENDRENGLPQRPEQAAVSDRSLERGRRRFFQTLEVEERLENQQGLKNHCDNHPGRKLGNDFVCQEGGLHLHESSSPTGIAGPKTNTTTSTKSRKSLTRSSGGVKHWKESYECSYCGKKWPCLSQLLRHESIHTGEKPHKCTKCGKSFNRRSNLTMHERTHTGEKPHKCSQCGKSFIRRTHLTKHKRTHVKEKSCNCSGCRRSSGLTLSSHLNVDPSPQCSAYGRSFLYGKNATSEESPGAGKLNKCSYCGKSFSCQSRFLRHERSHTKERPYQCPDCGKSFCTSSNLSQHKRTHTGERPYCCRHCGKSYRRKSSLVQHEQETCQKGNSLNAPPVGFVVLGSCALLCAKQSGQAGMNGPPASKAGGVLPAPQPSSISTGCTQ
ncbi:uncharacterized protein LOC110090634 [Pogona vitticeps]